MAEKHEGPFVVAQHDIRRHGKAFLMDYQRG
jgi:hypothetical protein